VRVSVSVSVSVGVRFSVSASRCAYTSVARFVSVRDCESMQMCENE
jgi:hypothetical protein